MNSMRIEVVKLMELNCKEHAAYPFAVRISTDGLIWWVINRFKTLDEGLLYAKGLNSFVVSNQLVKAESIIWSTQI